MNNASKIVGVFYIFLAIFFCKLVVNFAHINKDFRTNMQNHVQSRMQVLESVENN